MGHQLGKRLSTAHINRDASMRITKTLATDVNYLSMGVDSPYRGSLEQSCWVRARAEGETLGSKLRTGASQATA
jgi:hypothetical protein